MPYAPKSRQIEAVGVDHPCHRCGYNLRGLVPGAACPECGTPMRLPSTRRLNDTLADAPPAYLRGMCVGLTLMAGGSVGVVLAALFSSGQWRYYGSAWGVLMAGAWVAGVWLVTRPRALSNGVIRDAALDLPAMRWTLRGTQAAWLLAAAAVAMAAFLPLVAPPPGPAPGIPAPPGTPVRGVAGFRAMVTMLQVVGVLALAPLGVFLVSLASWAGDTGIAERLRVSVWGIGVGGVGGLTAGVLSPFSGSFAGVLQVSAMIGWGGALAGTVLLVVSVLQLAYLGWWAVRNNAEQGEVQARLARRRAQHEQRLAGRTQAAIDAMKDAHGPSPIGPGGPALRAKGYDEGTVHRPPSVTPYPLEPEG